MFDGRTVQVRLLAAIGWGLGLLVLAPLGLESQEPPAPPSFDIALKKAEDRIEVETKDEATVLTVTSPSGIGSATLAPPTGKWPGKLVLRLRLKGLESLTISHATVTLGASFSSQGDAGQRVYLKEAGQEKSLAKDHPYGMEIKVVGGQAVPLQGGHFEMVLPAALFKDQPKTVTIRWIDFYRG